jgi:hypothetical protein
MLDTASPLSAISCRASGARWLHAAASAELVSATLGLELAARPPTADAPRPPAEEEPPPPEATAMTMMTSRIETAARTMRRCLSSRRGATGAGCVSAGRDVVKDDDDGDAGTAPSDRVAAGASAVLAPQEAQNASPGSLTLPHFEQ